MFQVEAYQRPSGSCPFLDYVNEVLVSGRKAEVARIHAAVQKLREAGSAELAKVNLAEKMNDVWQLRPGRHRVFYLLNGQQHRYVLLNGYLKQSRRTPANELRRAENLVQEYLSSGGNKK